MERSIKCDIGSRYGYILLRFDLRGESGGLTSGSGPAHAVYFATYEVVKQAMGGNAAGHHPIAAGKRPKVYQC